MKTSLRLQIPVSHGKSRLWRRRGLTGRRSRLLIQRADRGGRASDPALSSSEKHSQSDREIGKCCTFCDQKYAKSD